MDNPTTKKMGSSNLRINVKKNTGGWQIKGEQVPPSNITCRGTL